MEEYIIGKTIHENIKTMINNKNLINYSILRLALEIEIEIIKLGNSYPKYEIKCAFPTGININDVVAHYTPCKKDKTILNSGDVCKIDYGISVDGYIYDGAFTVYIFKENDKLEETKKQLIECTKDAFESAKKMMKLDQLVGEIGANIEEIIESYSFKSLHDLCGHQIERYQIHKGLIIPNYDCSELLPDHMKRIKGNSYYAVEPYASTDSGKTYNNLDIPINHFMLDYNKYTVTDVLNKSLKYKKNDLSKYEKYNSLCFTPRWLGISHEEFKSEYTKLSPYYLPYPVIMEKNGGIVSQYEETIYVPL